MKLQLSLCFFLGFVGTAFAQPQTLEVTASSASPRNGPVQTAKTLTLFNNTDNPGGVSFSAYSPVITATFSLSNQRFTSIEGNAGVPGLNFGGQSSGTSYGGSNSIILANDFVPQGNAGSPAANLFSSSPSNLGSGISLADNYGVGLMLYSDALINASGRDSFAFNAKVYYGDLTITFNRPVSNPIINMAGMGGDTYFYDNSVDSLHNWAYLGYSGRLELASGSPYKLTRLSGSTYFSVNDSSVDNSALHKGAPTAGDSLFAKPIVLPYKCYAASGSFMVYGTGITSVTFRVYLSGDGGAVHGNFSTSRIHWSDVNRTCGDRFIVGVSLQKPPSITGNVFNDPDGGFVNNSSGTTNAVPAGMHVLLVDTGGKVVADTIVSNSGTYTFNGVYEGQYTTVLGTTALPIGATAVASTPAGWVGTGEYNGLPNTGNDGSSNGKSAVFTVGTADVSNINFAIERTPLADLHQTTIPPPVPNQIVILNGVGTNPPAVSGTDPDDGIYKGGMGSINAPNAVVITSLPNHGALWYNGRQITTVDTVITGFNPALLEVHFTGTGYTSTTFGYAYRDTAGKQGTSNTYTLDWAIPLPVQLLSFTGVPQNCSALLRWETGVEASINGFAVMQSDNATRFNTVATVIPKGNHSEYSVVVANNKSSFFRLKMIGVTGDTYSNTLQLGTDCAKSQITVAPNPSTGTLRFSGLQESNAIWVLDMQGRVVVEAQKADHNNSISIENLKSGPYLIQIRDAAAIVITKMILKN